MEKGQVKQAWQLMLLENWNLHLAIVLVSQRKTRTAQDAALMAMGSALS